LEVARDVQAGVEGAVRSAEPSVRYLQIGDSSIQLQANLRALDFAGIAVVRHEFVKRLQARFRREGIVMPYPIRTLDFPSVHSAGLKDALGSGGGPDGPERPVGFRTPAPPERKGS